jgi:hypothetical protein
MTITINGTTGIAGVDGSASTPAVQGADTNTGLFFGADTISFSEGGAQVGEFDSSANFKFNSGYGSVAVAYGCRAWVNFDGTGTVSIRASGNVTSITDNGTGDYTVNFTTAMPDANYSAVATPQSYHAALNDTTPLATNSAKIITFYVSNTSGARTLYDVAFVDVAIFR